jgi:lipoyl(octanoyl) transferase
MTLEVKISRKLIPYKSAFKFMIKRVESLKKQNGKDLLWILEHPLTFTGGIRSKDSEILDKKIKIIKTNRGGKITLHNPGQKIIYLVLNLNNKRKDIRNLVKQIEKSIIEFLKLYKLEGCTDKKNVGVWVKGKKIAAIGIRVSQWITYHGCSININNNLKHYKRIIPCGLDNGKITSVENEGKKRKLNIEQKLKIIFTKNLKNI